MTPTAPTAARAQTPGILPATDDRPVPAHARQFAARLSALFQRDVEIVARLNDAHHRLAHANEQLHAGPNLDAPQQIHWQIHRAFCNPRARARFCRGPPRSSRLFTPAMMRRPVGDVDPGGRCGDTRACAQGLVEVGDRAAYRPGSQDDREVPGRQRADEGAAAELR